MPGEVIAEARSFDDMVEAFRLIKERIGLSNAFCDERGGLTPDQTNKILGPRRIKNLGPLTFSTFCTMFAVKFQMVLDMEVLERQAALWERRNSASVRVMLNKLSTKMLERARPYIIRDFAKSGGLKSAAGRNDRLTDRQRSTIARKAARARWRKRRARA